MFYIFPAWSFFHVHRPSFLHLLLFYLVLHLSSPPFCPTPSPLFLLSLVCVREPISVSILISKLWNLSDLKTTLLSLMLHCAFKIYLPFPQVAPCVNNTKVDFSWTVTCTESSAQQKAESSASFQATRYQATLRISQGVLTGGVTCTFNVTGSMNYNPDIKSMVSQDIKALSSLLEPAIFGGKVVGVGYWSL